MSFQIEIKEGHDPSSYFWFKPVVVKDTERVTYEATIELDDEFSIEEGDVDCFLAYFLFKYFDENLIFNKNRYESYYYFQGGFEWYLTHNYYTYSTLEDMLNEISDVANRLEANFDDPVLVEVKKKYSIFYLCPQDSEDWIKGNTDSIRKYKGLVVDFYRRFVIRLRKMMADNPSTNLISIMGP